MKIKIIIIIIFFTYNLLYGQVRSDRNLTTGFGPAAMKSDSAGNIHLSFSDGNNHEIYYQLFDSLFDPKKDKIKISSEPNTLPGPPRLTVNENYAMAVWDAMLYGVTRWGVFGRVLKINGDTLSSELRIDYYQGASISLKRNPDVISINDTTFWLTWIGNGNFGEVYTLIGREVNVFSGPLGNEIYMCEDLPPFDGGFVRAEANKQMNEIFCLFGGDFYDDTLSNTKIYYRRFDFNGKPLIPSTLFLRDSSNYQIWEPHLSYNPLGGYSIVWSEKKDSMWSIKLKVLDSNGTTVGEVIQVNSGSNIVSSYPFLGIDFNSNGESIVVWESLDNGKVRIYGQRFSSNGTKLGSNFKISTEPNSYDHYWGTVQLYNKNIITNWSSYDVAASKFQLWGNVLDFNNPVTSIKEDKNQIPIGFLLNQNYPNPFNPSTVISWQAPVSSWQTLKIYDLLGREVIVLVDEYRQAGYYEVEFDASSIIKNPASGIYFYQLKASDFFQTKKMILIK